MELKQYLMDYLCMVYCDTCANKGDSDCCDYCHGKNMHWSLSEETAIDMVKDITQIFKEATNAD